MHAADKIFVKTNVKAIRDTFFPNMWDFPICDIFIQQKACRETPFLQLPRLVRHLDLPIREILRVVGLLTVMIFF